MTTYNESKLKSLLSLHKPGTVLLSSWLEGIGISYDLQKHYRRNGWLDPVGIGAAKRPGEIVTWRGALYALQEQGNFPVHAGALTSLALQGYAHYVRQSGETVYLFSGRTIQLPAWFRNHDWGQPIHHERTAFLPEGLGLVEYADKTFSIRISGPERAIMECLHLAPRVLDLVECHQVMEGLTTLRPMLVQPLLEQCQSIKVKRLFLYMAEKAGHPWEKRIDRSALTLGSGNRSLVKGGVYVPQYEISVPKELASL